MGYNSGAYLGKGAYENSPTSSAVPYVEPDKSARTTALFEGISGIFTSAADFYDRVKYKPQPAYGAPNGSNVYWGGGASWIPGTSGEPGKLAISGVGGFSPILLIVVVIIAAIFLFRK